MRETLAASGERFEVALALLNEAVAYTGLGRYEEALASLGDAGRLFELEGNAVWAASASLETAVVLHRQGRHDACLALARSAAEVFDQRRVVVEAARAALVAARAAVALEQHGLARELIARALAAGESRDVPALVYQARQLLGNLARGLGDPQAALAEYDGALEALERLRGWLMVEFRADFLEDKAAVYEDAVDLCIEMRQPQRGLEYAERAKSRALLDLIANRLDLSIRARRQEDADLVSELGKLRANRDRLYRHFQGSEELRQRGADEAVQMQRGSRGVGKAHH